MSEIVIDSAEQLSVSPQLAWMLESSRHKRVERRPPHDYYVDGVGGYTSVTTLVHEDNFEPFDAVRIIARMRSGKAWGPGHRYFGMTDKEIQQTWTNGADEGTRAHDFVERMFRAEIEGTPFDEVPDPALVKLEHLNNFKRDHPHLRPFMMECMVFDEESKVAGAIDALFRSMLETKPDALVMVDWKRSRQIYYRSATKGKKGTPAENLDDCNYIHYCLQLNCYKYILEKNYGVTIPEMFLIVIHPDQPDYIRVDIPDMQTVVSTLFENRTAQVRRLANKRPAEEPEEAGDAKEARTEA
jgi:hypothetical protein